MDMTHPFLRGFLHEVSEKRAFMDTTVQMAMEHPSVTALGAAGSLLIGAGALKAMRSGAKPAAAAAVRPAAAVKPVEVAAAKGFSGKALGGAALAGGAGALYLAHRMSKKDDQVKA
jgi:uncharacterized membrane protein YdfJ with MMPL/SSD domain